MIIIVDANILFSALITPNGKLAKILSHPKLLATRISCHYEVTELFRYQKKIITLSKRTEENIVDDQYLYLKKIYMMKTSFMSDIEKKLSD